MKITDRHISVVRTPRRRRREPRFGRLLKTDEWRSVVRALHLSPGQARVVRLILQGRKDKQIAQRLGLSVATVRTYLGRIFTRLGAADRVELVLLVWAVSRELAGRNGCHHK
jgi:DNA-binding NarL/FixJ family response regulator